MTRVLRIVGTGGNGGNGGTIYQKSVTNQAGAFNAGKTVYLLLSFQLNSTYWPLAGVATRRMCEVEGLCVSKHNGLTATALPCLQRARLRRRVLMVALEAMA